MSEETQLALIPEPSTVYMAINRVQSDLASVGISKEQKNVQQGYKFRGIDDIYNTLSRLLSTHGLVIIPKVIEREVIERVSQKGGALFYVTLTVDYTFVSVADGSTHTTRMYGEAMDSGDKGMNKALSAAYKYLCFQTFCIPTEGDNDADLTTHEVVADPKPKRRTSVRAQVMEQSGKPPESVEAYFEPLAEAIANGDVAGFMQLKAELDSMHENAYTAVYDLMTPNKQGKADYLQGQGEKR